MDDWEETIDPDHVMLGLRFGYRVVMVMSCTPGRTEDPVTHILPSWYHDLTLTLTLTQYVAHAMPMHVPAFHRIF